MEIKDRRPSSKLAPERLVEDPRKDQSQRPPPPLEPSKTSEMNRQARKEGKNTGLNIDRDNIQGKNQQDKSKEQKDKK